MSAVKGRPLRKVASSAESKDRRPREEATMTERYTVHFNSHRTSITSHPDGPWPRWDMARLAAIEHLESHVRGCLRTLGA